MEAIFKIRAFIDFSNRLKRTIYINIHMRGITKILRVKWHIIDFGSCILSPSNSLNIHYQMKTL